MPKIDQPKKNLPVAIKAKKTKSPKLKSSPIDYYNCLLTYANQGWADEKGTKQKITACCKDCKSHAPKLTENRTKEIAKLITSYHQVGESLKKLLKPIK